MGHWESNLKREIHRIRSLSQKSGKSSNKQSTLHLKALEKEQKTKPNLHGRKEIIIRAEKIE